MILGLVKVIKPDEVLLPPPVPVPVGLGKTDTLVTIGGTITTDVVIATDVAIEVAVGTVGSGPKVVDKATEVDMGLQENPTAVLVALLIIVVKL